MHQIMSQYILHRSHKFIHLSANTCIHTIITHTYKHPDIYTYLERKTTSPEMKTGEGSETARSHAAESSPLYRQKQLSLTARGSDPPMPHRRHHLHFHCLLLCHSSFPYFHLDGQRLIYYIQRRKTTSSEVYKGIAGARRRFQRERRGRKGGGEEGENWKQKEMSTGR